MKASRRPSHELWVELATRITSQRLHYRSGHEETAVASVVSLFKKVRELMTGHPEARTFHHLGLKLLNQVIRPYTARWHGWMTAEVGKVDKDGKPIERFRDEWVRRRFRQELRELQPLLVGFKKTFHALSRGETPDPSWVEPELHPECMAELVRECQGPQPSADLGDGLELALRPQVRLRRAGAEGCLQEDAGPALLRAEAESIRARRACLAGQQPAPAGQGAAEPVMDASGLALSGGGIRSATFCLGVIQGLQRKGLLAQFDYLSTVSGGGYIGSFISTHLGVDPKVLGEVERTVADERGKALTGTTTSRRAGAPPPETDIRKGLDAVFGNTDSGAAESPGVRHLRNHSRYLLHGGGWGLLRIAGVVLFGFVTSLAMLLTVPLVVAWGLVLLRAAGLEGLPQVVAWSSLAGLGAVGFGIPLFQRLAHGTKWDSTEAKARSLMESSALVLAVIAALAGLVWAAPPVVEAYETARAQVGAWVQGWLDGKPPDWLLAILASVVPAAFGMLSKRKDGSVRRWAQALFYLSAPAFFLLTFLVLASRLGVGSVQGWPMAWAAAGTGLWLVWAWVFLNINTMAPHRYYRDRLCECYLAMRGRQQRSWLKRKYDLVFHGVPDSGPTEEIEGVGTLQRLPLTALGTNLAAPYHLINATLNGEASKNPDLRGRNGDFFVFSRHYCGSPLTGYLATEDLEKVDPHVDLGTAMAISAAAASTNMGWKTLRQMRFLMTLFNVRLGYWMRRPGSTGWWRPFEGPGPYYFLCEMLGAVHERRRYVNLSDGGHIENLAAYELLRRQCRFIVCVDAGMEPSMDCVDLMRLQRYAKIDLGIQMHFDPSDLAVLPTSYSRAYAILVKVDYAPEQREPGREASRRLGWLLYLKVAVTGTEPRYVLDYRRQNPEFPHQTTGDQLYDEAQFEAYRALGECAVTSLFREELLRERWPTDLEGWFQSLASNLLPDNDEVFSVR